MPQRSSVELAEEAQQAARPAARQVVGLDEEEARDKSFLVVPDWWASFIPGGFDYCNLRNAPRFALLVGLLTLIIVAWQHLVGHSLVLVAHCFLREFWLSGRRTS